MIVDILTFLVKMTFRTCDKTDVPRSKQENEPKDKKGMSTESVDESSFKFLIITVRLL